MRLVLLSVLFSFNALAGETAFWFFPTTTNTVTPAVTNTKPCVKIGQFWTEWVYETNCAAPTRATMEKFEPEPTWCVTNGTLYYGLSATNYWYWIDPPCAREHIDTSEQVETTYCQSNLWARMEYRNRKFSECLESVCVKTNVAKWHWEKTKKYTH